jgi:hypothetical protein
LERAKIGKEPLSILNIFHSSFDFKKCGQKGDPSEKMDRNCHVFANSRWEILPPLLFAGWRYLGISQRLSYTLEEFPRGCPIAFGHFPAAFLYPFSSAQRLLTAFKRHPFSLKGRVSYIIF